MFTIHASAFAPGRVELLGNHTDYNEGVALSAAVDRGLTVQGSKRSDGVVSLTSKLLGRRVEAHVTSITPLHGEDAWANYPLGVLQQLQEAGCALSGFDAEITGDLPMGGGLSSSAALEVATALFLIKLHSIHFNQLELARLCRRAENQFVGVPSGLLDQVTSLFGKAAHVVHIDFRSEAIRTFPFPEDLSLVIADSGVKHRLVEGEYRIRREQCERAAAELGVPSLRDATMEQLRNAQLDPVLERRAAHIIGENRRVTEAIRMLSTQEISGFGELLNESHESSRTNFENSTAELDLLVEIARSLPGVVGARLTGGGFGGGIVAVVRSANAEAVAEVLPQRYTERSGNASKTYVAQIGPGAA